MGRHITPGSWCNRARKAGMTYQNYRYKHDPQWRRRKLDAIMRSYYKHHEKRLAALRAYIHKDK
jgi:predicted Zn-dependent peptidase